MIVAALRMMMMMTNKPNFIEIGDVVLELLALKENNVFNGFNCQNIK